MMSKFGCTTPFIENKSHICKHRNKSILALEEQSALIDQWYSSDEITRKCPKPCKILNIKPYVQVYDSMINVVNVHFPKFVKVSKTEYSYQELELFAEFGGYVGLFLGVAVVHLADIFEKIMKLFRAKFCS